MNYSPSYSSGASTMHGINNNPADTYQIIDKLGKGTYGMVFKAINKITDQLVAIKILQIEDEEEKEAFINQFEFLRNLDHPCIVKILDIYFKANELWIVSEYCQLGSVADIIDITQAPFTEPEIAYIVYKVLIALEFIHTQNYTHRDLKLSNILVSNYGNVKLADLEIKAIKRRNDSSLLKTNSKKLYPYKIDIWELGVCILGMAERSIPKSSHYHEYFALEKRPILEFSEPGKFSETLKGFLSQCLNCDPNKCAKASELKMHPFILKYKPSFDSIRLQFYDEKIAPVTDARRRQVLRASVSKVKEPSNVLNDLTDKINTSSESSNIKLKGIAFNDFQALIEKSGDSFELNLAICSKSQTPHGGSRHFGKPRKNSFSGTNNISREIIGGGGGPFTRESFGSVVKVSSFLEQNNTSNVNLSISSNMGIGQVSRESMQKHIQENPFFLVNYKKVSPVPTFEGEEAVNTNPNKSFSSIKSEKTPELKSRLKLDLTRLPISLESHKTSNKDIPKNYQNIKAGNFVVGKIKPPSNKDINFHNTSESEISPISAGGGRATPQKPSRRIPSTQPLIPHKISNRQLTPRKPSEVIEDEIGENEMDVSHNVEFEEPEKEDRKAELSARKKTPVFKAFESIEKSRYSFENIHSTPSVKPLNKQLSDSVKPTIESNFMSNTRYSVPEIDRGNCEIHPKASMLNQTFNPQQKTIANTTHHTHSMSPMRKLQYEYIGEEAKFTSPWTADVESTQRTGVTFGSLRYPEEPTFKYSQKF